MPAKGLPVSNAAIKGDDGQFKVSGEMTFATVTGLLAQSRELFAQASGSIEVELEAVERVDSAGLALLIEWMREARTQGKTIRFSRLPAQMMAIATASDLESILPLAPGKGTDS